MTEQLYYDLHLHSCLSPCGDNDMTPSNIHTFEICAFYVPLAVIILSGVVFLLRVKISEKMHADIVEQLETQLNEG